MLLLGYFEEEYDESFWDKAEQIPGGFIILREIRKAISGESFFYNCEDTMKPKRCEAVDQETFSYYYKIWENFNSFGLPHGSGWIHERNWLLEFLKIFTNVHILCMNIKDSKMRLKQEVKSGRYGNH